MGSDFRILGEIEVLQDGDPVALGSPRQRALLARLLINPGEVVSTDRIVEDLWHGDPPHSARHTLHVYVSRLRKALTCDGERLVLRGAGYRFAVGPDELDALRFERLAAEGHAALARHDAERASSLLGDALNIWRGPALAEFADEAFAREDATRLNELRLAAVEHRMWADLELGRHRSVVGELQDLVTLHPYRETLWEQLMLGLYRCGRQVEALRVYQRARSRLSKELGIEPGPALQALERRVLAQDPSLEPMNGVTSGQISPTLPPQRTSFVGRERELELGATLLRHSRLLTLTGPPGTGKTRLALQLATDHAERYPHGSFFVSLAGTTSPRMMDSAVFRALDLREAPGESALDGIKAFLRHRRALLILDNFEQILPAADQVSEILDAAPALTVLVTSRAPLRISGEQEFPVPPLGLPPVDDLPDAKAIAGYDAVALFLARARAVVPNFELNDENASFIARIAAHLDGLPLAIELAATRVKLLTPQDLLRRLEKRLTLLTGGPTDASERHRTMRDAIGWSYGLLGSEEQTLFRRLGVFAGGFTLEAATAVADLPSAAVFAGVDVLLSMSLVYRPVVVGEARFAMLQVIREFAYEQLAATGEVSDAAGRHAQYFRMLAESIEPQLSREPGGRGSQRLNAEVHNLRGALDHALEAAEPDLGLSLASCIWRHWQSCDQFGEGNDWLDRLIAHPEASDQARAKGLAARAGLAYWQADYAEALVGYEEALRIHRAEGDRMNEADVLSSMSITALWLNDLDAGERYADESHSIFSDLGSREGMGRLLMNQGFLRFRRNDFVGAHALYEEALVVARELEDQPLANTLLLGIAVIWFHRGERSRALQVLLDAVDDAVEMQNVHLTVWVLDFVAAIAAPSAPEEAIRLAGAVEHFRQEAGGGVLPGTLGVEDARTAGARVLGRERMERCWLQGGAMSLDEAVETARRLEGLVFVASRVED